eukprot:3454409-Amphidinium_carterae.1
MRKTRRQYGKLGQEKRAVRPKNAAGRGSCGAHSWQIADLSLASLDATHPKLSVPCQWHRLWGLCMAWS